MTGNVKSQNKWPEALEVGPQMDRLLGSHRVPQRGLLPLPTGSACSPPTPGWWDWGSGRGEALGSEQDGSVLQEGH